jgi:nucleoside-diphosphate-sugar epimerase
MSIISNGNGNGKRAHGTAEREIQRVCVIGGAGFVGSVLIERLLEEGYSVTVLDALMYGDEGIRHVADRPGFQFVHGDLRDLEAVVAACRFADAVVHLGALVGDPACDLDEQLTLQINRDATFTAAAVARGLGIDRFIFASTCSVYGATDDLLHEGSPLQPISLYARSKMESEQLLLSMTGKGFCPVVLRFGTFYGRSPRERFDLVVNLLAAKAVQEGEIAIIGGQQWRPLVHVADGAEAILRCLQASAPVVAHQVFNVGSDEQNHTLTEVAGIISELIPGVRVNFAPAAAQEANYRVSFARIRSALDFRPRYTLADGINEIRSALKHGVVGDYTETRYSNYKAIATGQAMQALDGHQRTQAAIVG